MHFMEQISGLDAPQLTDEQCEALIECLEDVGVKFEDYDDGLYPKMISQKDIVLGDVHGGIRGWFIEEHVVSRPGEVREIIDNAESAVRGAMYALAKLKIDPVAEACVRDFGEGPGKYSEDKRARLEALERCMRDCAFLFTVLNDPDCKPEVKRGARRCAHSQRILTPGNGHTMAEILHEMDAVLERLGGLARVEKERRKAYLAWSRGRGSAEDRAEGYWLIFGQKITAETVRWHDQRARRDAA